MFKNLISPVQAWLLSQARCVGCGTELSKGTRKGDLLTCKCGRIYKETLPPPGAKTEGKFFRRAKLEEIK